MKSIISMLVLCVVGIAMCGCGTLDLGPVDVDSVMIVGTNTVVVPADNGIPAVAIKVKVDLEQLAEDLPDYPIDKIPIDTGWIILNADVK